MPVWFEALHLRLLWTLPAALLGAALSLLGMVVHRQATWLDDFPLPWGVLLAVAAPAAVALVLRGCAPAFVGFLLGWLVALTLAVAGGPGGDYFLMADVLGWSYLGADFVVIGLVAGMGAASNRRRLERARA